MSMPESDKKILLRVRNRFSTEPWAIDNFEGGGWKVRNEDNTSWLRMRPENVRVANPEHDDSIHDPDDSDYPKWLEPIMRET